MSRSPSIGAEEHVGVYGYADLASSSKALAGSTPPYLSQVVSVILNSI